MVAGLIGFIRKMRDLAESVPISIRSDKESMNKVITLFANALGYRDNEILYNYQITIDRKEQIIDLAIIKDKQPIIAFFYVYGSQVDEINALSCRSIFNSSKIPFIALTNGMIYKFFTDLDHPRRLDDEPFLQIDMLNLTDPIIRELHSLTNSILNCNYIPKKKIYILEQVCKEYTNFKREPILGEEAAENDWFYNDISASVFCNTNSYQSFRDIDTLYLFGLRGSGKTAFIKMLEYEILHKYTKRYSYVNVVNHRYLIDAITHHAQNYIVNKADGVENISLKDLNFLEFVDHLKAHWIWLFNISAMFSILRSNANEIEKDENLEKICNYLIAISNRIDPEINLEDLRDIINRKTDKIIEGDSKNFYSLLKSIAETAHEDMEIYDTARKSLIKYLTLRKSFCLVMIDAIDYYEVKDTILNAAVNAIIEAAKEIYTNRMENRILVKAAFPSEILLHLDEINPDHTLGHKLFIEWRYRDLIILLAKRYYRYLIQQADTEISSDELKRLNDYDNSREFFYRYIPEKIKSSTTNIELDTIAFILLHTHKKPRQLIYLFNIIFTISKNRNSDLKTHPDLVFQGTHVGLEELVKNTLNIYGRMFLNASELVRSSLYMSPNSFDDDYLDWVVSKVSSSRGGLNAIEVKKLLLECGAMGIEVERKILPQSKVLILGKFQYQVPNLISPNPQLKYIIHPMYYPSLEIYIDMDKLIYPVPVEQGDEEKEALKRLGIKF